LIVRMEETEEARKRISMCYASHMFKNEFIDRFSDDFESIYDNIFNPPI
jgi:hypothetical protein